VKRFRQDRALVCRHAPDATIVSKGERTETSRQDELRMARGREGHLTMVPDIDVLAVDEDAPTGRLASIAVSPASLLLEQC